MPNNAMHYEYEYEINLVIFSLIKLYIQTHTSAYIAPGIYCLFNRSFNILMYALDVT